jgi:hypothetical protein
MRSGDHPPPSARVRGTRIHEWIWHGPIGGTALYVAFLIHFLLALWALYQRRSIRMGWGEGVRLALGFMQEKFFRPE